MKPTVSGAEMAELCGGVTVRRVQQLAAEGRIRRAGHGRYDPASAAAVAADSIYLGDYERLSDQALTVLTRRFARELKRINSARRGRWPVNLETRNR